MSDVTFVVYGQPATKGSTRSFYHSKTGRIVTMADAKGLAAWAGAVRHVAQDHAAHFTTGPVELRLCFGLTRPRSVSSRKRPLPTAKPDLDKLVRAVKDALTGVLWKDDAQVVALHAEKQYTDGPSNVHIEMRALWPVTRS
jgi:crossover junction endodeoxyribonuclease RusA